ncbi:o-succinylbenzoate synthase [Corynebacterium aquatimens]
MVTAEEILERAHVVALPMAVRFRGVTTREALLIDGPHGWGEFSPFIEYAAPEASAWLRSGIEAAFEGLPHADGFVQVNGTVPAVTPGEVEGVLARFPGVSTFKIKVAEKGQSLIDDLARVRAVHTARPDATLRIDANCAWSVDEAVEAARGFATIVDLEYMEQPCATVEELAQLRYELHRIGLNTPVAADESIRRATDPLRVAELNAADVAVMKVAPLGGVRAVAGLVERIVDKRGVRSVTVASALDTAVGIAGGLVAAKLTESNAAGLATQRLFVEDVVAPRELFGGGLAVEPAVPDPDRLADLAAPAPRRDWWFTRVRQCCDYLESRSQ